MHCSSDDDVKLEIYLNTLVSVNLIWNLQLVHKLYS